MLQSKMLLQPYGQKIGLEIGDVFIALMDIKDGLGDYKYYIRVPESQFNAEEHINGVVLGHDRSQNSFRLLQKILNDWGETQTLASSVFMEQISKSKEYGDPDTYAL